MDNHVTLSKYFVASKLTWLHVHVSTGCCYAEAHSSRHCDSSLLLLVVVPLLLLLLWCEGMPTTCSSLGFVFALTIGRSSVCGGNSETYGQFARAKESHCIGTPWKAAWPFERTEENLQIHISKRVSNCASHRSAKARLSAPSRPPPEGVTLACVRGGNPETYGRFARAKESHIGTLWKAA